MSSAYTLKKRGTTSEIHMFEGAFINRGTTVCNHSKVSICKKMESDEGTSVDACLCLTDEQARLKCAQLGKMVCGVCVSHLYNTDY